MLACNYDLTRKAEIERMPAMEVLYFVQHQLDKDKATNEALNTKRK